MSGSEERNGVKELWNLCPSTDSSGRCEVLLPRSQPSCPSMNFAHTPAGSQAPLALPFPSVAAALGGGMVFSSNGLPKCFFITFSHFQRTSGVLERSTVLGPSGSGVPGQLWFQEEPWCCCLGCWKPKPLGSFIKRVLNGESNCVSPPVAMVMGNAPLQRQPHTGNWGKKDLIPLLFPRHSTSKRKSEVCFPHIP